MGRFFLFIAGGIAVIIVGFFMLRGNMRMWDSPDDYPSSDGASAPDGRDRSDKHDCSGSNDASNDSPDDNRQ